METSITFPGLSALVPSARLFVRGILAGSPRADDLELIAAVLVSTAIRYSPGGEEGDEFTITVRAAGGWARLDVHDTGTSRWNTPPDPDMDAAYVLGLAIIDALADKYGHDGDADGQTMWAEITWTAG